MVEGWRIARRDAKHVYGTSVGRGWRHVERKLMQKRGKG
jgi:hypothetical protein